LSQLLLSSSSFLLFCAPSSCSQFSPHCKSKQYIITGFPV
jgi:hypothetical protein